jgi:hypothetical protein
MTVPRLLRRGLATGATAFVALLAISGVGTPALAHGGDGVIEVVTTIRQGDDVFVRVRLTYEADGHGVPDATVTAVVDGETPVPLAAEDQEGLYSAPVPAEPGATIRVSSVEPATSVDVEAPALEEEFPVLPSGEEATSTTTAPATTESTTPEAEVEAAPTPVSDEDDGSSAVPLIVGGVVVAGLVAGLAIALTRKGPGDDHPDGDPVT